MWVIRASEAAVRENGAEAIFEGVTASHFPQLMKDARLQTEKAQCIPSKVHK